MYHYFLRKSLYSYIIVKEEQLILILDNLFMQTMNFCSIKRTNNQMSKNCERFEIKPLCSVGAFDESFFWFIYRNRQSSEARLDYFTTYYCDLTGKCSSVLAQLLPKVCVFTELISAFVYQKAFVPRY